MKKWLMLIIACIFTVSCTNQNPSSATADETITIYFARHGKTLLNTADRVQGWIDSPLTEQGREVAKYLGAGLKGIDFDSFYTSDAGRQRETMSILLEQIGQPNATVHEDKNLREAYFGGFEGDFNRVMANGSAKALGLKDGAALFAAMRQGQITAQQTMDSIVKADPSHSAESYQQVKLRTQKALQDIINRAVANGEKNILAVSSGTSIQIMISDLTDNIDKNKPLANATIVKITYRNGQYSVDEIGSKTYIELGQKRLNK